MKLTNTVAIIGISIIASAASLFGLAGCGGDSGSSDGATTTASGSTGGGGAGGSDGACQPPSGLIAWWPGDGTFSDITKNPADGVSTMAPNEVEFDEGKDGEAFDFVNQGFVEIPNTAKLDLTGPLTLEAWIYLRSLPKIVNTSYRIIDKNAPGAPDGYDFDVIVKPEGPKLRLILGDDVIVSNTLVTTLNTWIHVATTFDGTTGRLYIDGVEQGNMAMSAPPTNDHPVRIGAAQDGTNIFDGMIDEAILYDRALSAAEIMDAVTSGHCKPAD